MVVKTIADDFSIIPGASFFSEIEDIAVSGVGIRTIICNYTAQLLFIVCTCNPSSRAHG